MDIELILQDVGFTKAEAKVYLALQKLGETKSGKIIQQTGLQSSVVHNALNTLQEKGFITYVLLGKIKHYHSLKPRLIKEYLINKTKDFENIIPSLESLNVKNNSITTAEVFTGVKGLMAAVNKMIETKYKDEIYRYFSIDETQSSEQIIELFEKLDNIKKDKKIIVKGIADKKNQRLKKYINSEIRFTNKKIPPAMNIYGNKILFYSFNNKPSGVLIESKEMAEQYKTLWDNLWNNI